MINVYMYLDDDKDASKLANELLQQKLVGHISIDFNNNTMMMEKGKVKQQVCSLITAQTKAMLFNKILAFINENYSGSIKLYSAPITQSNDTFAKIIREETEKV